MPIKWIEYEHGFFECKISNFVVQLNRCSICGSWVVDFGKLPVKTTYVGRFENTEEAKVAALKIWREEMEKLRTDIVEAIAIYDSMGMKGAVKMNNVDEGYDDSGREDDVFDIFAELFDNSLFALAVMYDIRRAAKGDTWKEMSADELRGLLAEEYAEYSATENGTYIERNELIDVALVALMLVEKLTQDELDNYEVTHTPDWEKGIKHGC